MLSRFHCIKFQNSPDSRRVSHQTEHRNAQTSIPAEANPEESGYYTGRSQPLVANSITTGIESKYLSQSLKKSPPSAYSYETEDRVGSWVSKSHQSALNKSPTSQSEKRKYSNSQLDLRSGHRHSQSESRRRTRSSDGSLSLSSSNKLRLNNRRRRFVFEVCFLNIFLIDIQDYRSKFLWRSLWLTLGPMN